MHTRGSIEALLRLIKASLLLQASAFVHTPVAPQKAFFLAECAYDKYEAVANTQASLTY
jgi:hypothetical protein